LKQESSETIVLYLLALPLRLAYKRATWLQNNRFIQFALQSDKDTFNHFTNCSGRSIIAGSAD
jgi:hypothetical protein